MYPASMFVGAYTEALLRTPLGFQTGLQFLKVNLAHCYLRLVEEGGRRAQLPSLTPCNIRRKAEAS